MIHNLMYKADSFESERCVKITAGVKEANWDWVKEKGNKAAPWFQSPNPWQVIIFEFGPDFELP